MRISDWSSDVCSSDLKSPARSRAGSHIGDRLFLAATFLADLDDEEVDDVHGLLQAARHCRTGRILSADDDGRYAVDTVAARQCFGLAHLPRSAERRGGKECVSTCRSPW